MIKNRFLYYIGRVFQRVALFLVIGATITHWTIIIVISANIKFISSLENSKFKNSEQTNELISRVIDTQSVVVLRWLIIATVITLLLLFIKRFRKYEKAMLVDSATIIILCMLSVIFAQIIVKAFVSKL